MRKYPEVQLAPDQYDKLATEVTFNGKKILPPEGYLIGQITGTNNGMLVEFVKKPEEESNKEDTFNNNIGDFTFDTSKIYYVKAFGDNENEFWLFKPRNEKQERLTEHVACLCVENGKVDYDYCGNGRIMNNNEIVELREATPSEIEIFLNTVERWKSLGLKISL